MSELPTFRLSSRDVHHHVVVRAAAAEQSPATLPFVTRTAMRGSDFAGFTPAGLSSFARILRLAKERREQSVIGEAFDRARVTP